MLTILAAASAAAASCAAPADPAALLAANRAATLQASAPLTGTMTSRYAYHAPGMEGTITTTIDLASGRFMEDDRVGPTTGGDGFDGRTAWMRDLSGFVSPQAGGDKRELAVNEAYRNANLWWRADRGGARIEPIGCGGIRVTPEGGKPFEAWFDPKTRLLARIDEVQSFGSSTETRFADYRREGGLMLPGTITIVTDAAPDSAQTLTLRQAIVSPARAASAYAMPSAEPADWALPPSGEVTLPFRLLNNHIIVEAKVNGRGPFPFLVDTGGHDIVTPSTVKALSLDSQGHGQSGGAGANTVTNGYAHIDSLDAGGAALRNQTVLTLDFSPVDVEGLQVGGMLGVEFFERFVVRIDYGAKTISFIDPKRFGPERRAQAGTAVPFAFYEHMPQVEGRFDDRSARFDIDTGSRVEVTLTSPYVAREKLRDAYPNGVTVTDGWGVGGPSHSYVVRAHSLALGPVRIDQPIAGFSTAKRGVFGDANYAGNIGTGLLKRFVVTFDYPRRTMYLKRLARPDADTSQFDRSGMWLNLGQGGLAIMDVAANGPAAEAGLKVGDVVTAIGGAPVATLSLSDARRMLKLLPVGKPVAIAYTRGDKPETATITPRDLVPPVSASSGRSAR